MNLKVALGQMNIDFGNKLANEEKITEWTAQAASQGADLILFPELWSTGYDLEHRQSIADRLHEGLFSRCASLARRNHIYLGGSLLERDGGAFYNTFVFYGPEGNPIAFYRKIHLFRPMGEDKWLCAGDQIVLADAPWGLTGLSICYDLRFPELFRRFATQGARVALLPAEWPSVRIEHWRTLIRARAIENQMFVIATNRVGTSPNETFGGYSTVVDPWGKVLIEGGQVESLLYTEIDLDEVDRIRQVIPILDDRRPDIY